MRVWSLVSGKEETRRLSAVQGVIGSVESDAEPQSETAFLTGAQERVLGRHLWGRAGLALSVVGLVAWLVLLPQGRRTAALRAASAAEVQELSGVAGARSDAPADTPQVREAPITPGFDCDTDFSNWHGWTVGKQAWCCVHRAKACQDSTTQQYVAQVVEDFEHEAACGAGQPGADLWTKDKLFEVPNIVTAELCNTVCQSVAECGAWTWGKRRGVTHLSDVCFLKKLANGERPTEHLDENVVSGVPCAKAQRQQRAQAPAPVVPQVQESDFANCTGYAEDCGKTRCCKQPGTTCYQKNEYWATCLDSCTPGMTARGDARPAPWGCEALGDRTPWVATCSWSGEDCGRKSACCQQGYQCIVKDQYYSTCHKGPAPGGWDGRVLGGPRGAGELRPAPADQAAGTTLFCFMAVLPGSPEEALVTAARDRKAHIFGCEGHAIYQSSAAQYQKWSNGQSTLVNTAIFIQVWEQVRQDGQYLVHDWTVKVDADCVFFPARLRSHIQKLSPPAYRKIYLTNTLPKYTLGGFLGAIEILSKQAVESYLDNSESCQKYIGLTSGEDGFLKDCLDALGVHAMHDEAILHPDPVAVSCQVGAFVAFHPLKSQSDWIYCYDIAAGNIAAPPLPLAIRDALPESVKATM